MRYIADVELDVKHFIKNWELSTNKEDWKWAMSLSSLNGIAARITYNYVRVVRFVNGEYKTFSSILSIEDEIQRLLKLNEEMKFVCRSLSRSNDFLSKKQSYEEVFQTWKREFLDFLEKQEQWTKELDNIKE